jgi:hypothetical protein
MATIYDTFLGNLGMSMSKEQLKVVEGKVQPNIFRSGNQKINQRKVRD